MIMFFALFHTGILIVLGFGGSGLEDSGVQLALAAVAVLTGLWSFFFLDDVMQDLFAAASDLPEDFAALSLFTTLRFRLLLSRCSQLSCCHRPNSRQSA